MTEACKHIVNAVNAAERILVCGHIRPDGDCISSALAMRRICQKLGKNADAVCDCEGTEMYSFLPDREYFCAREHSDYDLFIAVDCATVNRLGDYRSVLSTAKNAINIDHHPTNELYGKYNIIVPSASSTCAILFDIFDGSGLIDKDIATMLYTGLSTDTGHFMHSNTDADVFRTAMRLCEFGIDVGRINHEIYCNKSMNKLLLSARAINGITLFEGVPAGTLRNNKVAVMYIGLEDLDACGCKSEDTEGLIDYASSITGVGVAISMCEQPGSVFRVSYRSVEADVSAAAAAFGGGGHKLAAGCIVKGNRYDVLEKLVAEAKRQMEKLK